MSNELEDKEIKNLCELYISEINGNYAIIDLYSEEKFHISNLTIQEIMDNLAKDITNATRIFYLSKLRNRIVELTPIDEIENLLIIPVKVNTPFRFKVNS